MKRMIVFSMIFHLVLFSTFFLGSWAFEKKVFFQTIPVRLVALPQGPVIPQALEPKPDVSQKTNLTPKEPQRPKELQKPKEGPKRLVAQKKDEKPQREVSKLLKEVRRSATEIHEAKISPSENRPEESKKQEEMSASVPSVTAEVKAKEFRFPFYLTNLQRKISDKWSPPPLEVRDESQEVIISFSLLRSGEMREVLIEKSSGNPYFDQAALRAIYLSDPLPPLPLGFPEETLKVHFSFLLQKQTG